MGECAGRYVQLSQGSLRWLLAGHRAPCACGWGVFSFAAGKSGAPVTQVADEVLVHCQNPPGQPSSVLDHSLAACFPWASTLKAALGWDLAGVSRAFGQCVTVGFGCFASTAAWVLGSGNAPSRTEHAAVVTFPCSISFFFPFYSFSPF